MRLHYYRYRIQEIVGGNFKTYDLRAFLQAYCKQKEPKIKNHYSYDEEQLFLFHQTDKLFLFVITRHAEIIHKINTDSIALSEVHSLLAQNESLGFASYVYIDDLYFAFCSSQLAPRAPAFPSFVNEIFERLQIISHRLVVEPILLETTMKDVQKVAVISKASMLINKENSLFQDLVRWTGVTENNSQLKDLDSIEITFKAGFKKNIASISKQAAERVRTKGLEKMVIRGRREEDDRLIDMLIDNSNPIFDSIDSKQKNRIYDRIVAKTQANKDLLKQVKKIRDEKVANLATSSLTILVNDSAWPAYLLDLLETSPD
jgi:Mg2+ and Co2+ transporter CorA